MLNYEVYDNHKAHWVVFIHGIGGSTKTWSRQIEDFSHYYNLLLLDLYGHGNSDDSDNVSVESVNDSIKEVLDYLGIYKADFVGMSMGTIVVMQFAIRYPMYVGSVVFGGAAIRVDGIYKIAMCIANIIKYILPKDFLYIVFAWVAIPSKKYKKSRDIFIREAKKMNRKSFQSWMQYTSICISPNELIEEFKKLHIQTFFIAGEDDVCFLGSVHKLICSLPNSELKVLKNCGHVCTIEQYSAFNNNALYFLNQSHHMQCY